MKLQTSENMVALYIWASNEHPPCFAMHQCSSVAGEYQQSSRVGGPGYLMKHDGRYDGFLCVTVT